MPLTENGVMGLPWSLDLRRVFRQSAQRNRRDVPGFLNARPLAVWAIILLAITAAVSTVSDGIAVVSQSDEVTNPWIPAVSIASLILLTLGPVVSAAGNWLGTLLVLIGAGLQLFDQLPLLPLFVLVVTSLIVAITASRGFARAQLALSALWMICNALLASDGPLLLMGFLPAMLVTHALGRRLAVLDQENTASRLAIEAHSAAQQRSILAERHNIARDLHDIVAHGITIVAMQADAARVSGTEEQTQNSLLAISEASHQALDDMRSILRVLTTSEIRSDSEPIAVSDQVLSVEIEKAVLTLESQGFHVSKNFSGHVPAIPRSIQVGLTPVVRESITNVLKHASRGTARGITMQVVASREQIQWVLSNPIAEPTEKHTAQIGGFGLIGLRERMQLLGGTLSAGVEDGLWIVSATLYKNAKATVDGVIS